MAAIGSGVGNSISTAIIALTTWLIWIILMMFEV